MKYVHSNKGSSSCVSYDLRGPPTIFVIHRTRSKELNMMMTPNPIGTLMNYVERLHSLGSTTVTQARRVSTGLKT